MEFCCNEMELAVHEGIVKHVNILNTDEREFDTYYIEAVKETHDESKLFGMISTTYVDTQDTVLKHCLYCGVEL